MQLKIYKRSTALLGVVLLAILAAIIGLIITRESWDSHFGLVLFLFVLFVFILTGAHAYYDTRYDIDLIRKMVINKKIALAFDEQVVEQIEAEDNDELMDKIVTESRIIKK